MTILMALGWLAYGPDVERLGDPDYFTRAQAFSRLKEAGVWAVPALLAGRANGPPERHLRIAILLDRRAAWWSRLIQFVVSSRDVTPEQVLAVAQVAALNPAAADALFRLVDGTKAFWSGDSGRWCRTLPYVNPSSTYAGEIEHMLIAARQKIHADPCQQVKR